MNYICMNCFRDLKENEECHCKHPVDYSIAFGEGIKVEDGRIVCSCGNAKLQFAMHINMNPVFVKNYGCPECRRTIGTEVKVTGLVGSE